MKYSFILAAAFLVFCPFKVFSQPAALDISFASNGLGSYTIPTTETDGYNNFSLLQTDGKLIMGGTMGDILSLVRLNTDGTLDYSFGTDGKVLGAHSNNSISYTTGILQADGKILVGGQFDGDMYILRYNSDGSPDKTFNNTGQRIISFGDEYDGVSSLALQPDGKIIAAGYANQTDGSVHYAITRLKQTGALDNTFDFDGKKNFAINSNTRNICNAVTLQADGKIVMAGYSSSDVAEPNFSVARLNPTGSFDNSFHGNGVLTVRVSISYLDEAHSVAIQTNGKILLGGFVQNENHDNNFAVVRLNTDGMPDLNFDADGVLVMDVSPGNSSSIHAIAVQADGKILLAGQCLFMIDGHTEYTVVRIKGGGMPDNTFNADGIKFVPVLNVNFASSIHLYNDKIIVSGTSTGGNGISFSDKISAPTPDPKWVYSCIRLNTDGSLDASFSGNGKSVVQAGSLNDEGKAMIIDPNGKILVCGNSLRYFNTTTASLIRQNTNGSRDVSLDLDGKVLVSAHYSDQKFNAIASNAEGKILLAGSVMGTDNSDFFIGCYNTDGTPDGSFAGRGFAYINISGNDTATSISVQPDGKIVIAGVSDGGLLGTNISIIRLTTAGILDNSFDGDGKKTISSGLGSTKAYAVVLQSDGKILISGFAQTFFDGKDFTVIRLNTNGSFDNTFDGDGKAFIKISNSDDICYSMQLQGDGKIVLAGSSGSAGNSHFAVARLNTNGSIDNTFGLGGSKIIFVSSINDVAKSVALQGDGKIVVAGYSYNGTDNDAAVVRLKAGGNTDNTFDDDGIAVYKYAGTDETINAVNIQTDEKIVLAGSRRPLNEGFSNSYFVMRLLGGNAPNAINENIADKRSDKFFNASLGQNFPNPFFNKTSINCTLPQSRNGGTSAQIIITDKNGKVVKQQNCTGSGHYILEVDASMLAPGLYTYTMYVDGRLIGSKQMMLIK